MEENSKVLQVHLSNQRPKLEAIAKELDLSLAGAVRRLIREYKLEEGDRDV